jgi:general secretion pathway protein G
MTAYRTVKRGFTLVEILIVVIILGILAAIVIPQFTNASQDARKNSLTSQLQTIRSQLELYKMQHQDKSPALLFVDNSTDWSQLTGKTDKNGTTTGSLDFGPYLQQTPANPLNGFSKVNVGTTDPTFGASGGSATAGAGYGYYINSSNGKGWACSATGGYVYDESNATAANNDK